MKIVCSPLGIVDIDHPAQGVMDIGKAGFLDIVLDASLCAKPNSFRTFERGYDRKTEEMVAIEHPEKLAKRIVPFISCVKKEKLTIPVAMAPYLPADIIISRDEKDGKTVFFRETVRALTEETIKACGNAGCPFVIIYPVFAGIAKEDIWKVNQKYYLSFLDVARKNNVTILLKNQCRSIGGHLTRGICSDGEEAAQWVDALNKEAGEKRFGFCMDVGVCNLCGQNMYEFIGALGNRIQAVIVRDSDGSRDHALLPFTAANKGVSQTDWLSLIRGLRELAFDGVLILNMEDTAAAASPLLRPALLQYAKAVTDYLKWQIEIEALLKRYPSRVLFGAGNMCRNYMKCYGEKYPPLFTCDNNRKLWDTEFCGLTIRNPEVLKELPEDTAIFICNIYYREIELQLRDMGVQNPIVYFNDEYMPNYYFDRLEGEGRK